MEVDGVGIDIVEVSRIARMMKDKGFLARVFTEAEIRECLKVRHPEQAFAARFAAKEAVGKALGMGVGGRLSWQDIEIVRRPKGKPMATLSDKALSKLRQVGAPDATNKKRTLDTTKLKRTRRSVSLQNGTTPDADIDLRISMSHTEQYAVAVAIVNYESAIGGQVKN